MTHDPFMGFQPSPVLSPHVAPKEIVHLSAKNAPGALGENPQLQPKMTMKLDTYMPCVP